MNDLINISRAEENRLSREAFYRLTSNAIYVIRPKGTESGCGCPILCKGPGVSVNHDHDVLPDELIGILTLTKYNELVVDVSTYVSCCKLVLCTKLKDLCNLLGLYVRID